MASFGPRLPCPRSLARATPNRPVVRSRGVDLSEEMWQQMQNPVQEPDLTFPTAIFPAEQVTIATLVPSMCCIPCAFPCLNNHHSSTYTSLLQTSYKFGPRDCCGVQVLETLVDSVHQDAINHYKAFYSSVIGGITTHPVFMSVPVDDHMVHRGHAVFDTVIVAGGHLYQLDQHVERFIKSAQLARIPLPTHEAQIRRIIMDTAAASRCESGERLFSSSAVTGWLTS